MIRPARTVAVVAIMLFSGLLGARGFAPPRVTIDTGTLEGIADSAPGVMVKVPDEALLVCSRVHKVRGAATLLVCNRTNWEPEPPE